MLSKAPLALISISGSKPRHTLRQVYLENLELVGAMRALMLTPDRSFVPAAHIQALEFSLLIGQWGWERKTALQLKERLLTALRSASDKHKVQGCCYILSQIPWCNVCLVGDAANLGAANE